MDELNAAPGTGAADELDAIRRLLPPAPPPAAGVVAAARANLDLTAAGQAGLSRDDSGRAHGGQDRFPAGHGHDWAAAGRRHWAGWLAPAAAAAAVLAVVAGSLAVSSMLGGHRQHQAASSRAQPAATAKPGLPTSVPPYFLAFTDPGFPHGKHAEIHSTATGALLGSVTAPRGAMFADAAAAADDRTFVLAARGGTLPAPAPARMYLLRLDGAGRPGRLTRLPIPPLPGSINGFALSPDGSKLAVSVLPGAGASSSGLFVFSLATGRERTWTWPKAGFVGWTKPSAQSLSWESDNRTLLYQAHAFAGTGRNFKDTAGVYLLNTSVPGGNLLRASAHVPLPSGDISSTGPGPDPISGPILVTGDGAAIVAPTAATTVRGGPRTVSQRIQMMKLMQKTGLLRKTIRRDNQRHAPAAVVRTAEHRLQQAQLAYRKDGFVSHVTTVLTITEFSVRTGQPIRVLAQQRIAGQAGPGLEWTDAPGATVIGDSVAAGPSPGEFRLVMGVYTAGRFTPLPQAVQRYLYNRPTW